MRTCDRWLQLLLLLLLLSVLQQLQLLHQIFILLLQPLILP